MSATLNRAKLPEGAKPCPSCSTGYYFAPYTRCYLCNHPEERIFGRYTMDEQEDADFGHAMGLDWGD